jgi:hypothetical protein
VNVNPVVPPIDGFGVEFKRGALFGGERSGQQPGIFAFEHMLIVQNERLVELDEFFGASKFAFLLGERGFLHAQRNGGAIDAGHHRLLHGNGQALVTLLGNRNGLEFQLEPVLQAGLAPVILPMRKAG